jgi:hypothetical protein
MVNSNNMGEAKIIDISPSLCQDKYRPPKGIWMVKGKNIWEREEWRS